MTETDIDIEELKKGNLDLYLHFDKFDKKVYEKEGGKDKVYVSLRSDDKKGRGYRLIDISINDKALDKVNEYIEFEITRKVEIIEKLLEEDFKQKVRDEWVAHMEIKHLDIVRDSLLARMADAKKYGKKDYYKEIFETISFLRLNY